MKLEKRLISDLRPAEYNPRKELTPEDAEHQKIKKSIETFGYVDPIIINKDGTIIGGHQRTNVLADLGYTEVDVIVLDLNKNDEKALNIALNKITGDWDEVKLRDLLVDLDLGDYDISVTGFDEQEINDIIELTSFEPEATEDNFDVDGELEEPPFVRQGEVWQLGRHRLMCGDSTDANDAAKLFGMEQMDLIITDPPYNVDYEAKAARLNEYRANNNGAMEIKNDFMDDEEFSDFLLASFFNMKKYMREGAAIYVFHADSKGLAFRQAFKDTGLHLAQNLIWEKNNFVLGRNDYQWRHEAILYGWKDGAGHYFTQDRTQDTVILEDDVDFDSMKKPELIQYIKDMMHRYADQTDVIFEKKPMSSSMHPTMKPIELIAKFIRNSSKQGWNVGDLFGGSGSTLMAAEQLNRNAYIMELDEHYASVIIRRWEDFTGEKAIKIE